MDRLIYVNKLLQDFEEKFKATRMDSKYSAMLTFDDAIDSVNEQPTGFDIDDILRQCKDKAIELMNKQYIEDEYHMFSKGVQAMYLGVEKIIKEGGLDE